MPSTDAATSITCKIVAWVGELFNGIVKVLLRPASASVLVTAVLDMSRSKADLIAENALLRHQLALLKRQSKRPRSAPADRLSLLVMAKLTKTWRQALLIVQPATLLRTPSEGCSWHREGFRLFGKWKSRKRGCPPRISKQTIALTRRMAEENPL